jgi:hypothetical protein
MVPFLKVIQPVVIRMVEFAKNGFARPGMVWAFGACRPRKGVMDVVRPRRVGNRPRCRTAARLITIASQSHFAGESLGWGGSVDALAGRAGTRRWIGG